MSACCLICSQQATVYCHADEAFLCKACDEASHGTGLAARHAPYGQKGRGGRGRFGGRDFRKDHGGNCERGGGRFL